MANSNTVASPVVTLGLDAGGVKSGVAEALGVMKGAASAIAAISNQIKSKPIVLGVNSTQMLADLAGITDSVESALKLFERMGKVGEKSLKNITGSAKAASQASLDMVAKLSGTYNPMAAMTRSTAASPRVGPDPFLAGMKAWQDATKTAAKAPVGPGLLTRIGAGADMAIGRSMTMGTGAARTALGASARMAGDLAGSPVAILGAITRLSTPLNQTLELAAKAQRLLGAPIRSRMASEAGDADVVAGGARLMESGTLSGTLARFERQVQRTFTDLWDFLDQEWDIQGWIERIRGALEGVSIFFKSIMDPIKKGPKDPKALEEAFKSGARFVVNTFGDIAKVAIRIYNIFADIVVMIQKIPGLGPNKYTEDQESMIAERASKIKSGWLGFALGGLDKRGQAIADLEKEGKLDKNQRAPVIQKMGVDGIDALVKKMLGQVENLKLNNGGLDEGKVAAANTAIADFTRGLQGGLDPLANLTTAFEINTKKIKDLQDNGAGAQAVAAANIANQAQFAQGLADLARGRVEQMRASYQPGAAMDGSSMALAEAIAKASNAGQASMGGVEGQQLRALEQIRAESARAREINQRLLEAFQRNPPAPPVWVAPIAGGA